MVTRRVWRMVLERTVSKRRARTPRWPPPMALGGLHPACACREEPQPAGQACEAVPAGVSDSSDEWRRG